MAKLKRKIQTLNDILGIPPKVFYHGRIGEPISKEEMMETITIYNHIDEIKDKQFWELKGKTYLDNAFHGFYLTPCEALARKWALAKTLSGNKVYQLLVFHVNTEKLLSLNGKINIVPDSDWARHIYENRAKKVVENKYDFVYNFIADGNMADIMPKVERKHYEKNIKDFHTDILQYKYSHFVSDYYEKRVMATHEIFNRCELSDYKNYQLCISSNEALQCIELHDIIELPNDSQIPNDMSVDVHFEEYKKSIPFEISMEILKLKMKGDE